MPTNDIFDLIDEIAISAQEVAEFEEELIQRQLEQNTPMAFDVEKNFTEPTRHYLSTKYKNEPKMRYQFLTPLKLSFATKLYLKWGRFQRNTKPKVNPPQLRGPYR